jgi:hypothetical protein
MASRAMTRTMQVLAAALLASPLCGAALAAAPLADGAVVRVASNLVEAGWHTGRARLDGRKCWMVKLDKPTRDGYTMLALSFVKSVETAGAGGWTPLPLQTIVRSQPTECLEEGAD